MGRNIKLFIGPYAGLGGLYPPHVHPCEEVKMEMRAQNPL